MIDRENFLSFYAEAERPLRAYLLASTGDLHEAEDLAQNVWRALWRKLDQYDERRSFRAWAMGMARMEALKWRQRMARSRLILSEEAVARLADTAEEVAGEVDARRIFLLDCLRELGDRAARVLHLKYYEGKKAREIAALLGGRTGAVEMLVTRARRQLRDCVERKVAEAG